jgi:hypothetical protein
MYNAKELDETVILKHLPMCAERQSGRTPFEADVAPAFRQALAVSTSRLCGSSQS